MGFMSKVLGGNAGSTADDYVEFDESMLGESVANADAYLHIAEITGQNDVVNIKDAVYDGDIVVADLKHIESNGLTVDAIVTELRQVTNEVDGDIVQKGDEQLLITPSDIAISRQKL